MTEELCGNKVLTEQQTDAVFRYFGKDDVLFVLAGDLDNAAHYGETVIAFTKDRIVAFDASFRTTEYAVAEAESCFTKRCYGSAQFGLKMKDGKTEIVGLFSYRHFRAFDAAAAYINARIEGDTSDDRLQGALDIIVREKSTCPKCGRRLLHAGGECTFCDKRRTLIGRVLPYIKPFTAPLAVGVLLSLVISLVAMLPPYLTGYLVDAVFPAKDTALLGSVVLVLFLSYALQYGLGIVRGYVLRKVSDKMDSNIRISIFEKAQHLPMSYFDKSSVGTVMNTIQGDSAKIYNFLINVSQNIIVQGGMLVGIIIIMMTMHWKLSLLSLIPVPFVILGSRFFKKLIRPYYNYIWRRQSALHSFLTDNLPGIRVIKAFTNEDRTVEGYREKNEAWMETDLKSSRITIPYPIIVQFLIVCGSMLIWSVGGLEVISGTGASAGMLVSFISYASMFYGPVSFFAGLSDSYQSTLTSIEKVLDILDADPEPDQGKGNLLTDVKGRIEVRHVDFSFDNAKKTLNDVSFVIEPGDVVGIVGTTGAGKSTIMNLLMRFYDNYEGEILLDGRDIRTIDLESYRSIIGYVQQEPMMFHDTIFNNIAYGVPNASVERVIRAASVANAHDFIARMPDGYDTVLGERGVGVSGGERQRISIARAVFHDPKIMFFDEATASVDSETEAQIQEAIDRLVSGRTTIMIAHRLSTLKRANKIIVVDNGEILEMGSPDELIAKKGKFAKLIEIQTMSDHIRKTKEEERFD